MSNPMDPEASPTEVAAAVPDSPLLLRVIDVHKSYSMGKRDIHVLRGVSIDIAHGDFVALQGASGAGKTTLLHLLGALDIPNAGKIWFAGQDLSSLSSLSLARLRNRRVGFIFQAYHLLPDLDALENVTLPGRMARQPARETAAKAAELLDRVGLGSRLTHRPSELSGGEQQRVAIARALINSPELVLADEPTGNLDSRTGEDIIELLCRLRAELRTTLIMATHDSRVTDRAPTVKKLVDGQIGDSLLPGARTE